MMKIACHARFWMLLGFLLAPHAPLMAQRDIRIVDTSPDVSNFSGTTNQSSSGRVLALAVAEGGSVASRIFAGCDYQKSQRGLGLAILIC
jgi:hypothetical protein